MSNTAESSALPGNLISSSRSWYYFQIAPIDSSRRPAAVAAAAEAKPWLHAPELKKAFARSLARTVMQRQSLLLAGRSAANCRKPRSTEDSLSLTARRKNAVAPLAVHYCNCCLQLNYLGQRYIIEWNYSLMRAGFKLADSEEIESMGREPRCTCLSP